VIRPALLACTLTALASVPTPAPATSVYSTDPLVEQNRRSADVALSPAGGRVDLPASGGVTAHLTYPANDAQPGTILHVSGLGPAPGVIVWGRETLWNSGWKPFYVLTVTISSGAPVEWITLSGYPRLVLDIPDAAPSAHYYMDLVLSLGNDTHIPIGPPSYRDPREVMYDLSRLPYWARGGAALRIPPVGAFRLIAVRQ
jgi:hypothetical protein